MANKKCIALHCTSQAMVNDELKFHHFPIDAERRRIWIESCKRTDLINKDWDFFRSKYLCSLHFEKCMYTNTNLTRTANPSLHLSVKPPLYDVFTQTWESIKLLRPSPEICEVPTIPDFKKIEVRSSHTQTEEFIGIKIESDIIYKQIEKYMQYNEPKIELLKKDGMSYATAADLQSSEDEKEYKDKREDSDTSEMSVDECIQYAGIKQEIKNVLLKENILQTPTENSIQTVDLKNANMEGIYEITDIKTENLETSIALLLPNASTSSACQSRGPIDKEIQTDAVVIYLVPNSQFYFQQCIRCGKRQKVSNDDSESEDLTIEDFVKGCKKFLDPMFCTTVKNQIQLEQLLKDARTIKGCKCLSRTVNKKIRHRGKNKHICNT